MPWGWPKIKLKKKEFLKWKQHHLKAWIWNSPCGSAIMNPTSIREAACGSTPGLSQSGIAESCGVGHRRSSDIALLWLWLCSRSAAAVPIQPLAWELP